MKKWMIAVFILLVLLAVAPSFVFAADEENNNTAVVYYYKGTVLLVETITMEEDDTLAYDEIQQISQIEIERGPFAGRVYTIVNNVRYSDPQQIVLHVGDKVMLSAQLTEDGSEISSIYIYDYYRISQLLIGLILTVVVLGGVGLFKGLKALVSVLFVVLSMLFFFIPLLKHGHSAILLMIPICFAVIMINIIWDIGLNTKGISAFIGAGIGLLIAAVSGFLFEGSASLVGLGETELSMLYYASEHVSLDYTGLMTACVMLIALGPVLDGCVDVVQEMSTLRENNPYIGKKKLFLFGLKSGQGYMSRNINTIFFMAIASMLPIWIIFSAYDTSFAELINMDALSIQLFRVIAATIGIVLSMPATAYLFATLSKRNSLY